MNIPFVDLRAQYRSLKMEIDGAISAVIGDVAFIGNASNKYVAAFEREFAAYCGVGECIGCANGTDALEVLLKALGLQPGDEVLVPAVSWIATSEAVTNVGGVPVFVDIEATTYCIDPKLLGRKVTPRTRGIIPVHLYGLPADMDAITRFAKTHGLFVIEDCAQAHGARYKGRIVGTIGDAGSFSFFPGKNLGAYGDAGGMICRDPGVAETARMISQHGQGKVKHDHRIEGRNSRLDGIHAAILSVKLPHLDKWTAARVRCAALYRKLLADTGIELQHPPADSTHVYHLFVVQVDRRDEVLAELVGKGINAAIQYPRALPLLSAYSRFGFRRDDFPNAVRLTERCLSLPIYPELSDESAAFVVEQLKAAISR